MTIRLGGPLVGALVGLAAAGLGTVFLAPGGFDGRVMAVAAGSVLLCAAVAFLAGKSIAPPAAPAPMPPMAATTSGGMPTSSGPIPVNQLAEPARNAQVQSDRAALVEACIWMRDRATSPALAQHLDTAFGRVGVAAVDATGQRFDPAVHEAGSTVAAPSAAEDGVIARTETPGYIDRGRLLRHPVVAVYRGQVRA